MNRQVVDLGFIIKQLPDFDFSMDSFDDRLRLQKALYLLQSFGIYLGYDFSWYLRGPYCSLLTTNGFELGEIYDEIPDQKVKFKNPKTQKRFKDFLNFIRNKNTDELEIASSLHYLKQISNMTDDDIKNKVVQKQDRFTNDQINKIWGEIKKCNLI